MLALGGSAGTTIGTAAMRALPLGVPKVMLSTLASGMVRQFVGDKDIFMLNSVVDIAGHQPRQPAGALAGRPGDGRAGDASRRRSRCETTSRWSPPRCSASRRRASSARAETLERAGYEVLVFHATGNGGQAMESLIGDGLIAGVLDITTTELADEHVGGFLSAGPDRLTAAGRAGIPQVVSTGALDMVNFYAPESVPAQFTDRTFYRHNANVTLMRTTPEENAAIGADIARKLSRGDRTGRRSCSPRAACRRSTRRASRSTIRSRGGRCTTRFARACPASTWPNSICTSTIRSSRMRRRGSCSS